MQDKLSAEATPWDCRDELRQLGHNKDVLLERVHHDLAALWNCDYHSGAGGASLLLLDKREYAPGRYFQVRFVFWEESRHLGERNKIFLYDDVPHDHNFELLTVGYAGPGYCTSLWQYDGASVLGYAGEKVALTSLGRFNLAPNTVLWLQQNRDIHIQHSPAAPSVSLNLITWAEPQPRQYFFDIPRQRVRHVVPRVPTRREPLFQLAAALGDQNTLDLLTDLLAEQTLDPDLERAAMAAATHVYHTAVAGEVDE
ncbi:MAG: hypothetical protein AAGF11_37155 [Myxococcota bacterium]